MGKKTLIPEEKWEGLRHAMEEAAGARKTPKATGLPPPAEGEAAGPEQDEKRGAVEEDRKEKKGKAGKEKKKEKKGKKKKNKKGKKGKKGKGKKKKGGKKKGKG